MGGAAVDLVDFLLAYVEPDHLVTFTRNAAHRRKADVAKAENGNSHRFW
jgi:hypothetical protein